MKRISAAFTLIISLLTSIIVFAGCVNGSDKEAGNLSDSENDRGSAQYAEIIADWPYYGTPDELYNNADNIFQGTVKEIYFEIIDMKSGKADRDPASTSSDRALYTVYRIEVQNSYKGAEKDERLIKVMGGIPGFNESEQLAVMKEAGLSKSDAIPVYSDKIKLNRNSKYLFLTKNSIAGDFDNIINADQFAFDLSSETAKGITRIGAGRENNR